MFVDEYITSSDIAMVFVTSGTTGFSKLVPHTHATALQSLSAGFAFPGYSNKLRPVFNMQSLGWGGGIPALYPSTGCTRILIDFTNNLPKAIAIGIFLVRMFNLNSPDRAYLVPRDFQHVLDAHNNGYELKKQFDVIITGGCPVSNSIGVCYGATECLFGCGIAITKKSDFIDMCAGRPLINSSKIKVVGKDEKDVPIGEQGDILWRSENLFKGYLNNPAKTAEAFTQDGWYRTGDIGYLNKEGLLFVLCRKADAINKDGYIHYPGWMEQRINKHSGIASSVVIGIPKPVHHEEICLCYKLTSRSDVTADDLQEYCKTLFLTGENDKMTPLPKHYLEFDAFIINHNEKVKRKKMVEEILRRLSIDH